MADIRYKIIFHSPWHCGSGLSAGADLDALVVKDKDELPYIPGKTLKGLIREAVEDYVSFAALDKEKDIEKAFGHKVADEVDDIVRGEAFFTNGELAKDERDVIVKMKLQNHLYNAKSSTRIDKDGIADDHSLRRIETVVPCTLYAEIHDIDSHFAVIVAKAMGLIKRIGVNRNRGLGRCTFEII
jgi:CRISPR/Cas system CSM-associated protein Csm3 (group 7 of RAMP superfamily)